MTCPDARVLVPLVVLIVGFGCNRGDGAQEPAGDDTTASSTATSDTASTAPVDSGESRTTDTATETEEPCIPRADAPTMPGTASEYADLCEPYLGVAPAIDCGEGVGVPTYVDGVEVFEEPSECDNPDFKGVCAIGSTVGQIEGVDAAGNPLPDVVWAFFCRSQGEFWLQRGVASVQMIGHNTKSGATCFFESPDAVGSDAHIAYLSFGPDGFLDGQFPGPEDPAFDETFITSSGCGECHQSDAFIHTPWIDQARDPTDPSKPALPETAGPDSPYWVVGGAYWDLRTAHIDDNECTSCHRAPESDRILRFNGVDVGSFMPPTAPGSMQDHAGAIQTCYDDGPDQTADCEWVDPPGSYCEPYEGPPAPPTDTGPTDTAGGGNDCPPGFDPSDPCSTGDKCNEAGTWYVCFGGQWKEL